MPPDVSVERVERDQILALRARSFGGVGYGKTTFKRDMNAATRHWAAVLDGAVVGCLSVMALRGHVLRGMAVAPELRRRGIGAEMLRVACAEVNAPMWCNARLEAVPFYVHVGWDVVGPVFELMDRGPHQRLVYPSVRQYSLPSRSRARNR